jgi:hypothetical protein
MLIDYKSHNENDENEALSQLEKFVNSWNKLT